LAPRTNRTTTLKSLYNKEIGENETTDEIKGKE
jgi:hypothetical protein